MIEIILTVVFLILIFGAIYSKNVFKNEKFQIYDHPCVKKEEKTCYSDPLTTAKCWITKAFPCPKDNGSFMQCTNNYKRDINIADCLERTYYYSSKDERLSETCVYGKNVPDQPSGKEIGKPYPMGPKTPQKITGSVFPFAVKPNDNTGTPSIFPRVNTWRNRDLPNGLLVSL